MQPISSRLNAFLHHLNVSANKFSQALGYSGSEKISRLFRNDDSLPSVEIITDISNKFEELNIEWLLTGRGEMLKSLSDKPYTPTASHIEEAIKRKGKNTQKLTSPASTQAYKDDKRHSIAAEREGAYDLGSPKVVTINDKKEPLIPYVSLKARAAYIKGHTDPKYIGALPTSRVPGLDNASYRMFECEGPSMAPNILHGDKLVGRWLGSLSDIQDNHVHIIVTRGGVIVRRVLNHINKLTLRADTLSRRGEFPDQEIDPSDILEIWRACLKLSTHLVEPSEIHHRMADLEADMQAIKQATTLLQDQLTKTKAPKNKKA